MGSTTGPLSKRYVRCPALVDVMEETVVGGAVQAHTKLDSDGAGDTQSEDDITPVRPPSTCRLTGFFNHDAIQVDDAWREITADIRLSVECAVRVVKFVAATPHPYTCHVEDWDRLVGLSHMQRIRWVRQDAFEHRDADWRRGSQPRGPVLE
jgi:hypothetical protein